MSFLANQVTSQAVEILIACLLLLGALCLMVLGFWYYRKRFLADDRSDNAIWTFDDLRRMRDAGDLTNEEYETLRAQMLGSYRAAAGLDGGSDSQQSETPSSDKKLDDFDLEKGPDR